MPTRPHQVDKATVDAILREARRTEARVVSDELPPDSAIKKLGAVELQALDGSTVSMRKLWEKKPAAVVFLRHYG